MGGYVPIWKDLLTDPKFRRVVKAYVSSTDYGAITGVSHVIGGLAVLWIYADTHATEDDTLALSIDEVNELVGIPGFAELLPPQWLQVLDPDHVKLPNFHTHNGSTARRKIQNAEAQARWRERNSKQDGLRKQDNGVTGVSLPSLPIPSQPSLRGTQSGRAPTLAQGARARDTRGPVHVSELLHGKVKGPT